MSCPTPESSLDSGSGPEVNQEYTRASSPIRMMLRGLGSKISDGKAESDKVAPSDPKIILQPEETFTYSFRVCDVIGVVLDFNFSGTFAQPLRRDSVSRARFASPKYQVSCYKVSTAPQAARFDSEEFLTFSLDFQFDDSSTDTDACLDAFLSADTNPSHSSTTTTTKMGLTINIPNQKTCYLGTDPVAGTVRFQTSTPIPLSAIKITFTARSKAKIQKVKGTGAPAATYRSKCILFEQERILRENSNGENLAPGSYEWPFEFVFPNYVQPTASASSRWPEKVPYRNDAGHMCPPSFALSTGDASRKLECWIDYRLEAQVLKPAGGIFASKRGAALYTETAKLNFLPVLAKSITSNDQESATYRHEREQLFTIRSKLLHMENRGRTLKVSEKISSWLSPGQLPRFSFKATFKYPTRLIQAEPLTCSLDVTPFMEDSSVALAPEILLQSLSIYVVSETGARATPSLVGSMSAEIEEKIEVLSRTALGMPVTGTMDLAQVFGLLVLRHEIVSFATFNISRRYRLCASFVFECVGKTNEFTCPDLPIEIIAAASAGAITTSPTASIQEYGNLNIEPGDTKTRGAVQARGFAELPTRTYSSESSAEDLSPNDYSPDCDSDAAPPAYTPASSLPSPVDEKRSN